MKKVFKSMDLVQSYPALFQVLWHSINPCFDIRFVKYINTSNANQVLEISVKNPFCDLLIIESMQGLDFNLPRSKVNDKAMQMEGLKPSSVTLGDFKI